MSWDIEPLVALYLAWGVWGFSWIAAALWADRTVKRPPVGREIFYRFLTLAGFVLLLGGALIVRHGVQTTLLPFPKWSRIRFWQAPLSVEWTMVGVATLGFLFAWWARIHLGRLWSGRITRKEGHRVIDTGPYAIVRHPIYTGLLTSAVATTVVMGNLHAVMGTLLLITGYWIKARQEERFLREELGPQDYDAYRKRVPMLLPLPL